MKVQATDMVYFSVDGIQFPRVRSNFKFNIKPVYTNVNTSQTGVTSQDFVRDQIEISNIQFDDCTVAEYNKLCKALHIGTNSGGPFNLTFFNPCAGDDGAVEVRRFIVKELPATVILVKEGRSRLQIGPVTFQEV